MERMRHESIETTQKNYVGWNAERTADALWAAYESAQSAKAEATNCPGFWEGG